MKQEETRGNARVADDADVLSIDQPADGSGSLTFPCRSVFSSMMAQVRVWTLSVGQSDRQRGQTGRTGERGQVGLTVPSLVRLSELHCLYLLEK